MWPLKSIVSEKRACSEGFNTHLWGFHGDRWENVPFERKPRHVTPQINHLGKSSPVLRVSTHIYAVFDEIDGKTFIFRVNLGMWPLKSIVLEKWSLFWGFHYTLIGVYEEIDGKMFLLRVNLGMWPLKLIILEKWALFWGFQHTFMVVSQEIDGKMFILRVKLGMWPLKLIISEKWSLFWVFHYTLMGFLRR